MIKNMGSLDRRIRIIIAAFIAILYFTKLITGSLALILVIIAIAFTVTSFIGFCPIYYPFKFNTGK
jgi:hypothetical protein